MCASWLFISCFDLSFFFLIPVDWLLCDSDCMSTFVLPCAESLDECMARRRRA